MRQSSEQQPRFVYVIDHDGELDVFSDLDDAREASDILGVPYVEQPIFQATADLPGSGNATTRAYLDALRAASAPSELL